MLLAFLMRHRGDHTRLASSVPSTLRRYNELLSESVLAPQWTQVRKRTTAVFHEATGTAVECAGVKVNSTASIRTSPGNLGRGFDWKFDFFQDHEFPSRVEAFAWSKRYLKRQIEQKLRLSRDNNTAAIERCLGKHGITIEEVLSVDHAPLPDPAE